MPRLYRYVGPDEIRHRSIGKPSGAIVRSANDVMAWVRRTGQRPPRGEPLAVTYVVDAVGELRIADRHSEHVACAAGGDVSAAGEMFFSIGRAGVTVDEVSNQSTGYCPEPESWPAVGQALDRAGIGHPGAYTTACDFRRCPRCGQINIVKEGWLACAACGGDLPAARNLDATCLG